MKQKILLLLLVCFLSLPIYSNGTSEVVETDTANKNTMTTALSVDPDNPAIVRSAVGKNGMVVSGKPIASQIGAEILKAGGNAVDAAVATGFAVGVFEPNASGIGGGGFMTVYLAETQEVVVIDFREVAPGNATTDMFSRYNKEDGSLDFYSAAFSPQAIGVPGEVLGLETALKQYGTMTLAEVLKPVIAELESNGIEVTENLGGIISDMYPFLEKNNASAAIWLTDEGLPYQAGDVIKNPDLVNTLKILAAEGSDAIYGGGSLGQSMAAGVQALGGILTVEDLENYKVEIREPIVGDYRGYEIVSVPPSSSGGTHIVELLNIMENFDLGSYPHDSVEAVHLWAEAMKFVYADRSRYMADTAFSKVPLVGLTSDDYAKVLADQISMDSVITELDDVDVWPYESMSTTHMSVIDSDGNIVSMTKSINFFYGSTVTVPGTGIIMNNHMMDFDLRPDSVNKIEPGKRPLSSMSPSLVLKENKPFMVLGSPGGSNIIVAVAEVISNVIDYKMTLADAVNAPRMVSKLGQAVSVEGRYSAEVIAALEALGHEVSVKESYYASLGSTNAILIDENGIIIGVGDPRRDGQAIGY